MDVNEIANEKIIDSVTNQLIAVINQHVNLRQGVDEFINFIRT